jgi:hypothetical protein
VTSHLRTAGRRALVGLGGGLAAVVLAAAPALAADAVIHVKDSQVPTQAAAFANGEDCDAAGPIPAGFDAWHLILPGNSFNFTEVTGEFAATEDGPIIFTATAPGDNGVLPDNGNSDGKHAYLFAPAGLWLIDATAKISGDGKQPGDFVISHTCPGVPTSPSPSESVSPTPSDSVSPTPSDSVSPTPSDSVSPTTSGSPEPSESVEPTQTGLPSESPTSGGGGEDGLPVTGSSLTGILGAGLLLVLGGVALVVFARRKLARG